MPCLRGWRGLPAGWLAVTPSGDLADGARTGGAARARGRGRAVRRAAHGRRRELAGAWTGWRRSRRGCLGCRPRAGRGGRGGAAPRRGTRCPRTRPSAGETRLTASSRRLEARRRVGTPSWPSGLVPSWPRRRPKRARIRRQPRRRDHDALTALESPADDARGRGGPRAAERDQARDAWRPPGPTRDGSSSGRSQRPASAVARRGACS